MLRVHERVHPSYFTIAPPRPFPSNSLPDLLVDHILRPGLHELLDPIIGSGLILLFLVAITKQPWYLWFGTVAIVLIRSAGGVFRAIQRMLDEIALLRYGLAVRAHVLSVRPHRTVIGAIDGARVDCAIAVAPRRTYIGSIWLSNSEEALQVSLRGRLLVICLPRTPGTWRVVEELISEVRYERMGPIQAIPTDI